MAEDGERMVAQSGQGNRGQEPPGPDQATADESQAPAAQSQVPAEQSQAPAAWAPPPGPQNADGWVPRPRVGLRFLILGVVVLILAGAVGLGWRWVRDQINPVREGRKVILAVPAGATLSALVPTLARRGVIGSELVFRAYLHVKGAKPIQPGTYDLRQHEPYTAILATLARGPVLDHLVVPEGFTLAQIANALGKLPGHHAHFLAVARSGAVHSPYQPAGSHDLEGLLFPATYAFQPTASDQAILQMMVSRFNQAAAQVGLEVEAAKDHVRPYQAVTIASMVEREAKLPQDAGKVARVIYNRLNAGMPLQIDATVIYALGGNSAALRGHNPADVATKSPYNTYRRMGVPPTPIASPGLAALQAALHPTPGPWLYYVVVSRNGAEAFSSTYAGQQRNIALARKRGLPG